VIEEALGGRAVAFPLERAIFTAHAAPDHGLGLGSGLEKWLADYAIPGAGELNLHHFYRAMAWLGEELPGEAAQQHATPFAPHTIKGRIEEALFARWSRSCEECRLNSRQDRDHLPEFPGQQLGSELVKSRSADRG
jgi:hypothetical protein